MSTNAKPPSAPKNQKGGTQNKASKWNFVMIIIVPMLLSSMYYLWKHSGPPEMPNVALDEWWGDYPIDMKPDNTTKPFKIEFSEVIINDLKERLLHRRNFVRPLDNVGFQHGFNTDFLTKVLDFWQNSYDFQERENFLNKYKQYVTKIQGLSMHYIHVRPKAPPNVAVIPLLMIHNWPSSVREFYDIIPLLTTHKANQNFVFEVIAPSLPGVGFSQASSRPGLGPLQISVILRNLMERIGHNKYYIHAGDFGQAVASNMATMFPDNILGLHLNMPAIINKYAAGGAVLGSLWPSFLVEPEIKDRLFPLTKHVGRLAEEYSFFYLQATKPDTIGIALSESPAGLAAYILEKFSTWTNLDHLEASDGGLLNKFSLTHLLDNVMIYWTTNSITTSMRFFIYYYKDMSLMDEIPTSVPTWGIKFKNELRFVPDLLLKMKYHNYLHTTVVADGGHFPAMEHPQILADDIYDAVATFRQFHGHNKKE